MVVVCGGGVSGGVVLGVVQVVVGWWFMDGRGIKSRHAQKNGGSYNGVAGPTCWRIGL